MKRITTLILIISCFCLYCCNKGYTKSEKIVISPEYFQEDNYTLSYFSDNILYIPLDSQILIQRILKIEMIDSLIFISTSSDGPIIYNTSGTFIRKVGSRGNGPGEYKLGTSFMINKTMRHIYIIDGDSKIIVYDFDGNFIREIKRNFKDGFIPMLFYMNDRIYGFKIIPYELNNPIRWIIYDTLGNLEYSINSSVTGFSSSNKKGVYSTRTAYVFNNKLCYWNQFNDTIFELDGYTYKARYLFKKDKYRLTPELATTNDNFGKNQYYSPAYIAESNKYIFINYFQYKNEFLCIYDKSKQAFTTSSFSANNSFGIINDIDGGISFNAWNLTYLKFNDHEYLCKKISVLDLKDHIKSERFQKSTVIHPKKKNNIVKLANSKNENDNPILMLVRLKQ